MDIKLQEAVGTSLGATVARSRALTGGDINDAYEVDLVDGRRIFVKSHPRAEPRTFACEASGLAWLAESDTIRIPKVLAYSDANSPGPHFLALELIRPAPKQGSFDEKLGRQLAALHLHGASDFGALESNFIATLKQDNQSCKSWTEFYRERRLRPLLAKAIDTGKAPSKLTGEFDRLFAKLHDWVGPSESPARLHGDLWAGNLHVDERGEPCLIDPAVYGGHREMDLAMMRLFGGFNARVFDSYQEAHPLAVDHRQRVGLYQLYPLLVHVNLFGGSYVASLQQALRRYL